jgi:uncharacterized membrane protein YcaP (DUF421 family)
METILKAATFYVVLVFVLRIVGRRSVAHMTPFEMIIIFLVGGLAIQAIVADDRSSTNALLAILTVAGLHILVANLKQRYATFGAITDGTPVIVYSDGNWHRERMSKLMIQEDDVMAYARQRGLRGVDQIRYAIVERNGVVSIIEKRS